MTIKYIPILLVVWLTISCNGQKSNDTPYMLLLTNKIEQMTEELVESNDLIIDQLLTVDSTKYVSMRGVRNSSIEQIDSLVTILIELCGGRDFETGEIKSPFETDIVQNYLVSQKVGQIIKLHINELVSFLNSNGHDKSPLAFDANEVEEFKDGPWGDMSFSESHFDGVTLEEALAIISTYKLEIVHLENKVLSEKLIEVEINGL